MSLRGRYIIDRIKSATSNHFRMPCPPYAEPEYWNAAYASLGPADVYEWGDVSLGDLMNFNYRHVEWDPRRETSIISETVHQSSLGEVLGIPPGGDDNKAIAMVGCGNSKLGEEMVGQGGWKGPVIQVDVSDRVIESMSQRCHHLVAQEKMSFVQDDACELSAFRDNSVDSCLDKGLIDAIHCTDDDEQLGKILNAVGRVLKPGASFVFFSFSKPDFLLPKMMKSEILTSVHRSQWANLKVHELDAILMYKMQKTEERNEQERLRLRPNRIRKAKKKK